MGAESASVMRFRFPSGYMHWHETEAHSGSTAVCRLDEEDEEEDDAETEVPLKQQQNGAAADDLWVPVTLGLGLPLTPDKLCIAVCGRAGASNFLDVGPTQMHTGDTGCCLMLSSISGALEAGVACTCGANIGDTARV